MSMDLVFTIATRPVGFAAVLLLAEDTAFLRKRPTVVGLEAPRIDRGSEEPAILVASCNKVDRVGGKARMKIVSLVTFQRK